jgi:hypothetical protein
MTYLICILTGMILGIFACALLCGVILSFRPTPPTKYRRHKPPEVAQVPVVEAGSISYQFLGVTGEEQP